MNKSRQRFLPLALAALLLGAGAGELMAGANETPGANFRPHTFSSFSANLWEFGGTDVNIFRRWVVRDQHYTQGATYGDAANDLSSGGGGIWNFFTFCTDRSADVMLVTSHGWPTPTTSVEQYPPTPQGLAARDSVFNYYNGIFAAGTLMKRNWVRPNGTIRSYHIDVTQAFYTTYFMTPQAFAWWATCWSSRLNMTGPAEARCFLGYNNVVQSTKCYCDERRILQRMDGQQGQSNRPLRAAAAGINGACPPGGARLILQGQLNTTLSPSVTGNAPTGIVCVETPGFVSFDTTMDTTVPASNVVVALGDAYLDNHVWVGDDRIDFDVIPTRPCPLILYDVIESQARSRADRARLDGNLKPTVNARGPNRDDYIWLTTCPCDIDSIPFYVIDPMPLPLTPVLPGEVTELVMPVHNALDEPQTITLTLSDDLGWYDGGTVSVDLGPEEAQTVQWSVAVPESASSQTINPLSLLVEGADYAQTVEGSLQVDPFLDVSFDGGVSFLPGQPQPLVVSLRNNTEFELELQNLFWEPLTPGWDVQPDGPPPESLTPLGKAMAELIVMPPPSAPQGEACPIVCHVEVDGQPTQIPVGDLFVGLPLILQAMPPVGFAAGNPNAELPFLLSNPAEMDLAVNGFAADSHGFPVVVNLPPVIPAGDTVMGQILVELPPDPALVGEDGFVQLQIADDFGFQMQTQLNYVIHPALEITRLPAPPIHLGGPDGQTFDLPFLIQNSSALELPVIIEPLSPPELPLEPPFTELLLPPMAGLELHLQAVVLSEFGPQVVPVQLAVQTFEDGDLRGIGDQLHDFEIEVFQPVVVDLHERAVAGAPGEIVTVGGTILNLRQDASMSGGYQWQDQKDWLLGDLTGGYDLGPGESDSLTMELQLPLNFSAAADSDSVALVVEMTYDDGTLAESLGSTWVMVLGDSATSVPVDGAPAADRLAGIYPNPFNPATRVRFHLAAAAPIELSVLDASGRSVRRLATGRWEAGVHEIRWDGRDDAGRPAASGVYFVQLKTREHRYSSKAILLK